MMFRHWTECILKYTILFICLLSLLNCEPAGVDILKKIIHHYDEMLRIIDENKSDPKVAKEKLALYEKQYKDEYLSLIQELKKISFEKIENRQFEEKLQEFTEKNRKLIQEALSIGAGASF
jgi:predicted DNA binding protein